MKKKRFSLEQIADILKNFEQSKYVEEICRTHGVHKTTFYKWPHRMEKQGRKDSQRI